MYNCPSRIFFNEFLESSALHESAREQPAFISGIRTFFSGESIFAVSAINFTPAKRTISALFEAAFCESAGCHQQNLQMSCISSV